MPDWEPWHVRHIYTVADGRFTEYLAELKDLLRRAVAQEWISALHDCPIEDAAEIAEATRGMGTDELVIFDLHGGANPAGAWLGPTVHGDYLNLRDVPTGSWCAAAVVLTGCEGAHGVFWDELRRINSEPVATVGHFEVAEMHDHTPVEVIREILRLADGGDAVGAAGAAVEALRGRRFRRGEAWAADLLKPLAVNA